jgi:hypothetical protein
MSRANSGSDVSVSQHSILIYVRFIEVSYAQQR